MSNLQAIKRIIENDKVEILYLNFIDFKGEVRTKGIFIYELLKNLEGFFNDGISVTGNLIDAIDEGSNFFIVKPIAETFTVLNWIHGSNYKSAFVLCTLLNSPIDSRGILSHVVDIIKRLHYKPMCGLGITYCLDGDNAAAGNGYYKLIPSSKLNVFNTDAANILISSGIDIEYFIPSGINHNHLAFVTKDLLRAIDQYALATWITSSVAAYNQVGIKFSKPFENSAPIHFSIWDEDENNNLFYDPSEQYELSALGYSFIAGVLKYFDEIFAVIIGSSGIMPTINYKRNYSYDDDDNVISAPCFFFENGKMARSGWSKRCVFRGIMHETNLYLAVACIFLAGKIGVNEKLNVSDYCNRNYGIQTLSLTGKMDKLKQCQPFTEVLGQPIVDQLIGKLDKMCTKK